MLAPEEAKIGRLGAEPFTHPDFYYSWQAVEDLSSVSWFEVVVHLAAQGDVDLGFRSPRHTVRTNVESTVALLERCAQANPRPLLIYASSAHAMEQSFEGGDPSSRTQVRSTDAGRRMTEDDSLRPATPYGFSKAAGEMACWTWHRCYGLPVTVMSNGVVAGPGMRREHFLWKWLTAIYRGEPLILEGGEQTRDLTYVSDVLDAWMLVIEAPREKVIGEKFQVSYGKEWSLEALLEACFQVTGRRVPVIKRPYRPGEEGMRECFDISKARRVLGYAPKVDPFQAIVKTWEYVQAQMASLGVGRGRQAVAGSDPDREQPISVAPPLVAAPSP